MILTGSVTGLCLVLCLPARAVDNKLSTQDRAFLTDAAQETLTEVYMGRIGQVRGTATSVRDYSQRLIDDDTKENNGLKALAKQKGVSLPPDGFSTLPRSLTSKAGADFDKAFAAAQVTDEQKDIAEFEKEANSGSDPDVKAWAKNNLTVLRADLNLAKSIVNSPAR